MPQRCPHFSHSRLRPAVGFHLFAVRRYSLIVCCGSRSAPCQYTSHIRGLPNAPARVCNTRSSAPVDVVRIFSVYYSLRSPSNFGRITRCRYTLSQLNFYRLSRSIDLHAPLATNASGGLIIPVLPRGEPAEDSRLKRLPPVQSEDLASSPREGIVLLRGNAIRWLGVFRLPVDIILRGSVISLRRALAR